MLKSFFYYLRLLSVLIFIILISLLLDVIFSSHVVGISFLIMSILFIMINIFTILSRKKIYKELISYNLISIALTIYLALITFRYYNEYQPSNPFLELNYDYFQTNFIIISLVILGIILNTIFIYFFDSKEKSQ